MHRRHLLIDALLLMICIVGLCPRAAVGQMQQPRENFSITAKTAWTWEENSTHVVQLEGEVAMQMDHTHLSADRAVVWITPIKNAVLGEQKVEIALIGNASLSEGEQITRSGPSLFATAIVRGNVHLIAQRNVANMDQSELYRQASTFRPRAAGTTRPSGPEEWLLQRPWMSPPASQPAREPATQPVEPILFSADSTTFPDPATTGGKVCAVLIGNVTLISPHANGEAMELRADQAVLFTSLKSLRQTEDHFTRLEEAVTGAYLEGDVRMDHNTPDRSKKPDQSLTANRVFYDFTQDRAILTTAVMHTLDTKTGSPFIVRAQVMRQLSEGEYSTGKAQLTTSAFAVPSYSIGVDKAYIREIDTGDERYKTYTEYEGTGVTFQAMNQPFFYLPWFSGSETASGSLIRAVDVKNDNWFGTSILTQWGLFETLGKMPPAGTDITYEADYFGERGPAFGLHGKYEGGFITDASKEPWAFNGHFDAFVVDDHGVDQLGEDRNNVTPDTQTRYRLDYYHQHFLPDDWQVQISAMALSDPTFLEEWYPDAFFGEAPHDTAIYAKRQHDSEALTFLASVQPNGFVTSSDAAANQFEVEKLPEVGYHRIGDDLAASNLTFFSDDTGTGLHFRRSSYSIEQQGYVYPYGPGLPSLGQSGTTDDIVYRGDFRQEVDYPVTLGEFRVVPYFIGRYTPYSDSPGGSAQNRVYGGAGVRISTAFWRVDDTVESDLFDMHRLRHVIEPSVNLFAGAENVQRDHLFLYEEDIDAINDIEGAQFALNQRWQTKRGGPDRWRSTDVFTLNLEVNVFVHKPPAVQLQPTNFRGLFFDSLPETSIPRDSVNGDATWRISDTTAMLGDFEYNTDQNTLATASIGLAVRRDKHIAYFIGTRYIQELNSNITTAAVNYELSAKYTLAVRQSFDFGQKHNVGSGISIIRHFDRFYAAMGFNYDATSGQSGVSFAVYPEGLGQVSANAQGLQSVFSK